MTGKLAALTLLALLSSCALQLHEPAPDTSNNSRRYQHSQAKSLWQVHCETAESHSPLAETGPGVHHRNWIWANGDNDKPLLLDGRLEDGFLVVDSVQAGSGQDAPDVTASMPSLRAACLQTLARDHAGKGLELGQVRAARRSELINVPLVLPTEASNKHTITRMVIFGDSLSDTGNLKSRLVVFPGAPYWIGRFSNGPNWVDYLEAGQDIAVQNHAYGGASITHHGHKPGEGIIAQVKQGGQLFVTGSLDQQVDDYIANNLADGQLAQADRTLFLIWGGANDYIWKEPFTGTITTFLNSPKGEEGYETVVDEVIAAIKVDIEKLYRAGARNLLVLNLPDIGSTPIVLQNSSYFSPRSGDNDIARKLELSRRLTALTLYHNQQLGQLVAQLDRDLDGLAIYVEDTNQQIKQLLTQRPPPNLDFGFNYDAISKLLSHKGLQKQLQKRCYEGGYLGSSESSSVCDYQHATLFWDVIHPSTYTHCWQSYFLRQSLADKHWIKAPVNAEQHKRWCQRVAERELGHTDIEWSLAPADAEEVNDAL